MTFKIPSFIQPTTITMKVSILVHLLFGILTKTSALAAPLDLSYTNLCDGAIILATIWIGEDKNVEMKSVFCPNGPNNLPEQHHDRDVEQRHVMLEQRQLEQTAFPNVCGANCE